MSKAIDLLSLCESIALDSILSEAPEVPKRDYHFNFDLILSHSRDFNIVTQKVDDFSTMKHATDPWMYIIARLNKNDYIENAKVKVKNGEIVISNDDIEAGFDRDGHLTQVYTNRNKVQSDQEARLEDIFIKGCSKQIYNILELTFK